METQRCILADCGPGSWELSNGGQHRTSQIHELITGAGLEIQVVPRETGCSNFQKYLLGLKYLLRTGLKEGSSLRRIRRHGAVMARWAAAFAQHTGVRVLIWENTHPARHATPLVARLGGYAAMALPHNLESLVPDECRAHPNGATRLFREEVRHLGAAASVFCCAREEQWLLALHGVHADFLPYHPPGPVAAHCLAVRARRQTTRPQRWLILGSANYGPTYAGMAAVLEMLKSLPGGPRLPVDIAGFGSEVLRPEILGTEFRLHGAVDASVLARLLVEAKAVLLHQTAGAGALTRIAEMLTAGVPVLANPIAARSGIGHEGIHVYETAVELHDLLNRDLPVPPLPARPAAAERRFVAALDALVRKNSVGSVRDVRCNTID